MIRSVLIAVLFLAPAAALGQEIPGSYANIHRDESGTLYAKAPDGKRLALAAEKPRYTLTMVRGNPKGTERGIAFDFADPAHGLVLERGTLHFGFIKHGDGRFNLPVFFKRTADIVNGKAFIDIAGLFRGKYDMVDWQKHGRGTLGYRVVDERGNFLYDGKIAFTGKGPFVVDTSIVEGPFLAKPLPSSMTIAFTTNVPATGVVTVGDREYASPAKTVRHEIEITGLTPGTEYTYVASTREGQHAEAGAFRTPPAPGTRRPFTFAYASDSREGKGGGERSMGGSNVYMMKRIAALVASRDAAFMQFTGDEINGYRNHPDRIRVEYSNWKRAVEPWAGRVPIIAGMGNHESLTRVFEGAHAVDRFPFETESGEALFAESFVNFENGPESEDGSVWDPDPDRVDFPGYRETVFYYRWDNVAMVVLNSDYWYSPSMPRRTLLSGNIHGYLMDNQLRWLADVLGRLEADTNIDHVFVTLHTPVFPNGGHLGDDMWYRGSNEPRPWVAGKPVKRGIIERRDEFWKLLMDHGKVFGVLTGDEHNYSRLLVTKDVDIYGDYEPAEGANPKIGITRSVWQINNGAAGAPYYAREMTPWYDHLRGFTTQNAVVFFHVDGKKVTMEVVNPETLDHLK